MPCNAARVSRQRHSMSMIPIESFSCQPENAQERIHHENVGRSGGVQRRRARLKA